MKMALSLETTGSPLLTSPLMKESFLFAGQELWFATGYTNEDCGMPSFIWLCTNTHGEFDPRHRVLLPRSNLGHIPNPLWDSLFFSSGMGRQGETWGEDTTFSVVSEDIIRQLPHSFLNTEEECAVMWSQFAAVNYLVSLSRSMLLKLMLLVLM